MTSTTTALLTWDQMSDLDKGAALLHIHKVAREGAVYAIENYPCKYLDAPELTALDRREASRHARQVAGTEKQARDLLGGDEFMRLYDLALDEERRRSRSS